MQLKRSHACAIAAAVRLAESSAREWVLTRELCTVFPARQLYIVNVLRQLCVAGVVVRDQSAQGKYALARSAAQITLLPKPSAATTFDTQDTATRKANAL